MEPSVDAMVWLQPILGWSSSRSTLLHTSILCPSLLYRLHSTLFLHLLNLYTTPYCTEYEVLHTATSIHMTNDFPLVPPRTPPRPPIGPLPSNHAESGRSPLAYCWNPWISLCQQRRHCRWLAADLFILEFVGIRQACQVWPRAAMFKAVNGHGTVASDRASHTVSEYS